MTNLSYHESSDLSLLALLLFLLTAGWLGLFIAGTAAAGLIACIIGVAGIELLAWGSINGSVFYLLVLPPLVLGYYRLQGSWVYLRPD